MAICGAKAHGSQHSQYRWSLRNLAQLCVESRRRLMLTHKFDWGRSATLSIELAFPSRTATATDQSREPRTASTWLSGSGEDHRDTSTMTGLGIQFEPLEDAELAEIERIRGKAPKPPNAKKARFEQPTAPAADTKFIT